MTDTTLKSTGIVSSMTLLSRIIGFVRDMLVAQIFGATAGLDAFLVAFKIPNFLRRLFAEGAFSAAFVPVMSEYKKFADKDASVAMVAGVFGWLALVCGAICLLGIIASPYLINLFAPGFGDDSYKFNLATQMLRWTFPYLFFISLTAFYAGIQNTHNKFALPAFTPVILNLCMIFGALVLASNLSEPVIALAIAVFIAGILQWLMQIGAVNHLGYWVKPKLPWQNPGVNKIFKLMLPAILGASVTQINLLVDTIFASFLPTGSLTWLYYSDRLLEFPIGVFGVALATVALPMLSKHHAGNDNPGFTSSLSTSLKSVLLIGLPATIGLIILAKQLLITLFAYRAFGAQDVDKTSLSLIALSIGLIGFLLAKILVMSFYARQNTKFPVKVAIIALAFNVLFNMLLIGPLAHAGLALASSLAVIAQVILLSYELCKTKILSFDKSWAWFILRVLAAGLAMALWLWYLKGDPNTWYLKPALSRALYLFWLVFSAAGIYFIALFVMGFRLNQFKM